ncbi:MAG: c-type cytochrome biogenesis protein CcsB [Candidatus Bostrichicola ureolyticus]|nr:MAG: c-type cytochrome biogenesis protein CcsB [Candidatus Bostrichicola ureolyticus]
MFNIFNKILGSTKTTALLFIITAISLATATFIEEIYSIETAMALIYKSVWFEIILLLLCLNLIKIIFRLFKRKKIPILIFHLAFIIILIGGAISRYSGFEGLINIGEGDTVKNAISDKTYIQLQIHENNEVNYYKVPYILSHFNKKYEVNFFYKKNLFNVKILNYIPYAKETFIQNNYGHKYIKIVFLQEGKRIETYIKNGELKKLGSILVSFNNKSVKNAIQILDYKGKLYIISPNNINYTLMNNSKIFNLEKKKKYPINYQALYNIGTTYIVIPKGILKGYMKYISSKEKEFPNVITAQINNNNKSKIVTFIGGKGFINSGKYIKFDNKKIYIGYGSILIDLPFSIKLNKFVINKYPGSELPSSFTSFVTIIDNNQRKNFKISMNNVLNYKGYRFFQNSYYPNLKGTILSVNNDIWGTRISYLGYFLVIIGMFLTLFSKGTHFFKLKKKLKNLSSNKLLFILLFIISLFTKINAKEDYIINEKFYIQKKHADKFGNLLVQDQQGRIKPINTIALECLRKIYKKDKINNLNANQWFLSIIQESWIIFFLNKNIGWSMIPFIKVEGSKKLLKLVNAKNGYTSLNNLFINNNNNIIYILEKEYENALIKSPNKRNEYDKAVIKLNERINILSGIFKGIYIKIFPIPNDEKNTWTFENFFKITNSESNLLLNNYFIALYKAQQQNNWEIADKALKDIHNYQMKYGDKIIPTQQKIKAEILYNRLNIFYYVMLLYLLLGIILLFLSFFKVLFLNKNYYNKYINICFYSLFIIFVYHTYGLILRWYISNHAPWSNGYESAIFISWCIILIGLFFYKVNYSFVQSVTSLASTSILSIAHGNLMDPEITNLVPVLKSYWLIIHVAIIIFSYAFLIIGSFIGLIVLILYIINAIHNKKNNIILYTKKLTIINEITLTIGLFLLTIGTFLGGIWANESWGSYWNWDPKETWALISILVYSFILHMRLIPNLRGKFIFNMASLLGISSIIMTYLGVNYYFAGLHSYGKGDPIPIPKWIYYTLIILLIIIFISYFSYKKILKRKINYLN